MFQYISPTHTAVRIMPFSADLEMRINQKAPQDWEAGSWNTQCYSGGRWATWSAKKVQEGHQDSDCTRKTPNSYPAVFQHLEKNNGRCRKQQLLSSRVEPLPFDYLIVLLPPEEVPCFSNTATSNIHDEALSWALLKAQIWGGEHMDSASTCTQYKGFSSELLLKQNHSSR